jgi:protoheme IX farnesyltransferase
VSQLRAANTKGESHAGRKLSDLLLLVKFRLTATVVFSALMAYGIASTAPVGWDALMMLALGGFLVTGAANALNQVLEKDYDALMVRTANRPLATGRMSVSEAVLWAGFMSLAGITLLAMFNPWAAFFGMLALVSYSFIYTPLKRVSPIAITIGAFPGAMPMLIGSVAFEGTLSVLALSLFAIQFVWQFPHFWAIGWLGFDEYQKAGYKLLPERNGEREPNTGLYAMLYALMLVPLGLAPWYLGATGVISAAVLVLLALVYAWFGWNLQQKKDRKAARLLMFSSFLYLPLALFALLADKL